METVEILAGGEFANAVKSLGLTSAVCTYHYQPQPTHWREEYQVWLLSKEDFDNICAIDNDDWKDDWAGGVTLMVLIWALLTAPMLSMVKS